MSCGCGHGPWHRYGCAYPPQYPPSAYYPPEDFYERPDRRRRRRAHPEDLEDYLQSLQEEIDRVRQELAAMRESREKES